MRGGKPLPTQGDDADEAVERKPEKDFLGIQIVLCALMAIGAMLPIWFSIARV